MDLDRSVLLQVAIVGAGAMLSTTAIGWLAGWNLPRKERAAIALTSGISNNGNMGIPINSFAFGPEALSLASIYYVVSAMMTNTVGAVIAGSGNVPVLTAAAQVVKVPVVYAAVLGLAFNQMQWTMPAPIFSAIDILGDASIPCMLVLLGIQLRNPEVLRHQSGTARSAVIRLLVGPIVAWGLCGVLGIGGLERNVLITQAAMPTAVVVSVLATEFDTAPKLVATVIVLTTLLSMATLSVVLTLLM
jgi:predicted permease